MVYDIARYIFIIEDLYGLKITEHDDKWHYYVWDVFCVERTSWAIQK